MASQVQEPVVARSGSSIHSPDNDFTPQQQDNPLEVQSSASVPLPLSPAISSSQSQRHDPMDDEDAHPDEPPPPYEAYVDAPEEAPIEYSCENSPQIYVGPQPGFPVPVELPTPIPADRPSTARVSSTFSSAKAREAGFEIEAPSTRSSSSTSRFSIDILPSTEPLRHTREPGKLTAYLLPFPKPQLKNVNPEDVPDRFLIYTPPPPPLSKPAPGEREPKWHRTQRLWQEDVRKATAGKASKATWVGMKASATILIGKGVNLTRSSNVEFLDRVSGGAISSTTEAVADTEPDTPTGDRVSTPTSQKSCPFKPDGKPTFTRSPTAITTLSKAPPLSHLTLIYPPSLPLTPPQIRAEFLSTLLRTREKSRREAVVASTLLPIAATIDASLVITFGGLTSASGVWANTSIKGAQASRRMTEGLERGESLEQPRDAELDEPASAELDGRTSADDATSDAVEMEIKGCTCGHHEHDFGPKELVPKELPKDDNSKCPIKRGRDKDAGIALHMQATPALDVFARYLARACHAQNPSLFPSDDGNNNNTTSSSTSDAITEDAVLAALGWQPTRRAGRDLELDVRGRVQVLTPELDEQCQVQEARDDVKRLVRKGAVEWADWCKGLKGKGKGVMRVPTG
ncbi:hypothetical protein BDV95DRAFT_605489 [Massariosphaeria phaeospora]|uniref:Uncharacterized protein n=1 Tax=Massariosphaeria phaeospora TaxID=100035 RepID=A0A7C8MAH4_9PLEO|nr:hypothetical protein BDV95DRAFT_605489 [Massariosphaeria phaeospora]